MEKKSTKILIAIVVILVIAVGVLFAIKLVKEKNKGADQVISLGTDTLGKQDEERTKQDVNIFSGDDRPIAIMIDNHKGALPQAGLNDAYIVYEIIVEGGETRLMEVLKGKNLEKVGPIRSSRHYFLDYALENDAIYVHYGWSPQAQRDIATLGVNNINGITQSSKDFWRVKDKKAPHNAVTSSENIIRMAKSKKYRTTSNVKSVLNYTVDEVDLNNGEVADNVYIPYTSDNYVRWIYNNETKRYLRYSKGVKQTEWDTGADVTAKNIIIEFIANSTLDDGENKGRQTMTTTGTKDGYYITNGKAIKIKCTKNTRSAKTVYKDLDGNEIEVNDGNTFVQICPINAKVKMTENTEVE